uniref:(northern house mosquito) hypothetical protein n=1 Tax=Culex pipiens TaxID=7175 RepID=A0A8D8BU14_CULPI
MPLSKFSPTDDDVGGGDGTLIFTGLGRLAVPGPHLPPDPPASVPSIPAAPVQAFIHKQKQTDSSSQSRERHLGRVTVATFANHNLLSKQQRNHNNNNSKFSRKSGFSNRAVRSMSKVYFGRWHLSLIITLC